MSIIRMLRNQGFGDAGNGQLMAHVETLAEAARLDRVLNDLGLKRVSITLDRPEGGHAVWCEYKPLTAVEFLRGAGFQRDANGVICVPVATEEERAALIRALWEDYGVKAEFALNQQGPGFVVWLHSPVSLVIQQAFAEHAA